MSVSPKGPGGERPQRVYAARAPAAAPVVQSGALAVVVTVIAASFAMLLAASEWQPLSIDGATIANGGDGIFVRFGGGGRVQARGPCRPTSGHYHTDGDRITITLAPPSDSSSGGACAKDDLDIEARFFTALRKATRFNRDRTRLSLLDRDGTATAELRQTDWD